MSPIEIAHTFALAGFLVVAGYSAARFAWSVTRRGSRSGAFAADVPDLSHALMGAAMALMVSPAGPDVPAPLGVAAFAVLAAWFAARLHHDGVLSRAALPASAAEGPTTQWRTEARDRLGHLTYRDPRVPAHGGYHLHHLAGCAAMVAMYLTGHGALDTTGTAAAAAGVAPAAREAPATLDAAAPLDTHAALGGHGTVPLLAALCWAFGLYFLVAATSLGFRVGESTVRLPHHAAAVPRGALAAATPAAAAPAARLLTSPAGACATEVALSAGMAVLFFSAL